MSSLSGDIPHISSSTLTSTPVGLANYFGQGIGAQGMGMSVLQHEATSNLRGEAWADALRDVKGKRTDAAVRMLEQLKQAEENEVSTPARRLVQVLIVDSDENVPLDQCWLYKGEQKMTDLTDQELFFEIDIKKVLDSHNERRVKLLNKKVKERTEYLEPARVRDLKMVVVNIAQF